MTKFEEKAQELLGTINDEFHVQPIETNVTIKMSKNALLSLAKSLDIELCNNDSPPEGVEWEMNIEVKTANGRLHIIGV